MNNAYKFTLSDPGGGTYITDAATVEEAMAELLDKYGKRLMSVRKSVEDVCGPSVRAAAIPLSANTSL